MSGRAEQRGRGLRVLLWCARILGGLLVATLAFAIVVNFVGSTSEPAPTGKEWLGFAMFPLGIFVAYALAFRWELAGGALGILCSLGWWVAVEFDPDILPIAMFVAVPGVLYVVYGLHSRKPASVAVEASEE